MSPKKNGIKWWLWPFFLSSWLPVFGHDYDSLLVGGNAAFQRGQFDQALQLYQQLIDSGFKQSGVYYNLANCYASLGDRGHAVLNYQRALRLKPSDRDIRHNLAVISQPIEEAISVLPAFFLTRWLQNAANGFTPSGWAWITIFFAWLALLSLIAYIWYESSLSRKWSGSLFIIALLSVFIGVGLGWYRSHMQHDESQAVVIVDHCEFKYAPETNSETVHSLLAGSQVQLIDTIGSWYKVILTNKDEGWIEKSNVERL